jgi:hypothetical protein
MHYEEEYTVSTSGYCGAIGHRDKVISVMPITTGIKIDEILLNEYNILYVHISKNDGGRYKFMITRFK